MAMLSVVLLMLALSAVASAHDHKSSSSSSSSESSESTATGAGLNAADALLEAERLITNAKVLKAQGLLDVDNELIGSGNLALLQKGKAASRSSSSSSSSSSSNHSDDDDDNYNGSHSSSSSTELSTSDKLHIAVEERLIEAAIQQAFEVDDTPRVNKHAYQARYEITAFDGNAFNLDSELQYGPTVISTRSNFLLENSGECQWWTMGDFLDADQNGQPDIIPSLVQFRDDNEPEDYLRQLRNRATTARDGTIELINLITLDGRFSQTNQLLSTCFSATDDEEFVFETLVGVQPGQAGLLTAKPEQTSSILLAGSTALSDDPLVPTDNRNRFVENGHFVQSLEIPLYINLVPDQLVPGVDDVRQQGTVYLSGTCDAFSYFQ